uniref:Uncharacterized protein n=1 Tax=Setaria italica TaxID=4555 RepID=K3YA45_SETIT
MASPNGPATPPMVMYPFYPAGAFPQQAGDDQAQGPGIYAIQQNQLAAAMGMGRYAPTTLVPLTYKIPAESIGAPAGEGNVQDAMQQNGPQRQVVVRRFHFAFQLDLALIIKLAAVVFLFSQEGSKQRLFLLILFASLIYFLKAIFQLTYDPCHIPEFKPISNWSNYTFCKMASAGGRGGCSSTTGSCSGGEPCSSPCSE